jgi:hypothetical protein
VGQDEAQRPNDVGGGVEQALALEQGFADKAELVIFEVAQATMDQLRRGGGGIARQIALLAEHHGKATAHRIARDARAVDTAANDEKISYCRHGTRLSSKTKQFCSPANEFFSRLTQVNFQDFHDPFETIALR